ncbi:hypothetical protein LC147_12045 [Vibrio harveyi]|uniref:hypothetical protein n=1 Tax=Vibrio harveyi TaxID=669 RepID=UPI003BB70A24
MKFSKVNHEDFLYILVRKLVAVSCRDDLENLPQTVVGKLDRGEAHLFIGDRCGAVLELAIEDGEMTMYIVFGWSDSGEGIKKYIDSYYQLAKDASAKKIVVLSRRIGVYRLWRKYGFKVAGYSNEGLLRFEKRL